MNQAFGKYALKLFVVFGILYFGTHLFIGITAPGGYYSAFADKYLNYVKLLRYIILHGSKFVMSIFGYKPFFINEYTIKIPKSSSVQLVYSCLGYGVISFWIAFIIANIAKTSFKIKWIVIGIAVIIFSNILRICALLYSVDKKWPKFLSLDHHTTYNLINYALIIVLMLVVQKQLLKQKQIV